MRASARGGDKSYLLRDLDHTNILLRVKPGSQQAMDGVRNAILGFIREHPDSTVKDITEQVSSVKEWSYAETRTMVVRMVDEGMLRISGYASLEQVDLRYERVASCDLCGSSSDEHKVVLWKYNTPVVRCSDCGLMYANPRWKAEHLFGRYTQEYWSQYEDKIHDVTPDDAGNQARYDPLLGIFEVARENNRLLDIGCATGHLLSAAKARGWEVYGVETSHISAVQARQKTGGQIHEGTLDTAPFPEGWFDAITLLDVIEHLQSPSEYMRRIATLLRPGGVFLVATPNIHSLAYRLLGRKWTIVGPNDHLYYFSPRTLERLLRKAGFGIHSIYTTATEINSWQEWVRNPALRWLAPTLRRVTAPFVHRFLLGDQVSIVARRM